MPRNYTDTAKIEHEFGSLDNVQKNSDIYARLAGLVLTDIAKESAVILPPGYRLVRTAVANEEFEVALLCDTDESVAYYIKAKVWDDVVLSGRPVTQALLWRTKDVKHKKVTSGITEHIFFQYLLKKYNIVASDSAHTIEGRNFWISQMGIALAYGHYVYRYDLIKGEICNLSDHALIRDNSADLWGDEESYEKILAVISEAEVNNT